MKKSILFKLCIMLLISASIYFGCGSPPPTSSTNPPVDPLQNTTINIPRFEDLEKPQPLNDLDFVNGPCKDLFAPTTWTVDISIWYTNSSGIQTQYGTTQIIQNATIPPSGPITLNGVLIPSGGSFYLIVHYTMDVCSECCSITYLNTFGVNEGCDATIATGLIKQGKPQFGFQSSAITGTGGIANVNLIMQVFTCFCSC